MASPPPRARCRPAASRVEGHPVARALHHHQRQLLHPFVGGEALAAPQALPPAAHRGGIVGRARVDDLVVVGRAERAAHRATVSLPREAVGRDAGVHRSAHPMATGLIGTAGGAGDRQRADAEEELVATVGRELRQLQVLHERDAALHQQLDVHREEDVVVERHAPRWPCCRRRRRRSRGRRRTTPRRHRAPAGRTQQRRRWRRSRATRCARGGCHPRAPRCPARRRRRRARRR